jgi:hypothetical protein
MTMTYTASETYTYTIVDIETVVRRFTADLVMIAQSSGTVTETNAREYAHDVEALAKKGYLKRVDLTLLSGTTEIKATQYTVNAAAGSLSMSRPGGVLWPRVPNGHLRIILSYTEDYDSAAREAMNCKLKISWVPTNADTSHAMLTSTGGRTYASNAWAMERKDFAA